MNIYFIKCKSGYWDGFSHEDRKHLYTADKNKAAKYFTKDEAMAADSWREKDPLIYTRVEEPIEEFEIEMVEYKEATK